MKRILLSIIFGFGLACVCGAETRAAELSLDYPSGVSWEDGPALTLLWLEVEDSRCPTRVTCVWEGEVGGRFQVGVDDGQIEPFTLTRHHEGDERATVRVAGYQFRLEAIDPYPLDETGIARMDYRAQLVIAPPGEDLPDAATVVRRRSWANLKRQEKVDR
ncbi:MAG: hypothetical protein QF689_05590 [Candidatus Latescibacteria bacterium]|jgi:hypothetical protein|nr:hypothetical protein [Gemmatimonadaceae bacterium]MDP6015286.1 hypothetical protein [Candidatus Latescibacterota bacterium]MDP7448041.1 hypothetical protein [Candidatus Latescibacterota bacterium]HJP31680.1 hypothetical protein [Candidatus Latescibacterota bacterium]|tara:strand:+ start:263 stop:745 length:483 start_codon:yes stop_codon:yes gene_type:complete